MQWRQSLALPTSTGPFMCVTLTLALKKQVHVFTQVFAHGVFSHTSDLYGKQCVYAYMYNTYQKVLANILALQQLLSYRKTIHLSFHTLYAKSGEMVHVGNILRYVHVAMAISVGIVQVPYIRSYNRMPTAHVRKYAYMKYYKFSNTSLTFLTHIAQILPSYICR